MPIILPFLSGPPDQGSSRSDSRKPTSHRSTSSNQDGSHSGRHGSHSRPSHNKGKITQQDVEDSVSSNRGRSKSASPSHDEVEYKPRKTWAKVTRPHSSVPLERGRVHQPRDTRGFDEPVSPTPRSYHELQRSRSRSSHRSSQTSGGGPRRHSAAPHKRNRVLLPRNTGEFDGRLSPPDFRHAPQRSPSRSSHTSNKVSETEETVISWVERRSSQHRTSSRSSRRSKTSVPPERGRSPAAFSPERPSSQYRKSSRSSHRSKDAISLGEGTVAAAPPPERPSSKHRSHSRSSRNSGDAVPAEKETVAAAPPPERPSSKHRTSSRSSHSPENIVPSGEGTFPAADHVSSPTHEPRRNRSSSVTSGPSVSSNDSRSELRGGNANFKLRYPQRAPPVSRFHAVTHALKPILEEKEYTGSRVAHLGSGFNGDSRSTKLKYWPFPHAVRDETHSKKLTHEEKMKDTSRKPVRCLCRDPETGEISYELTY